MRVETFGTFRKPLLFANVLVLFNKKKSLELGVYINDVNNTIKQYFVSLVMIYF